MRLVGRLLQIAGLIVLPLAIVLELSKDFGVPFGLKDMLLMLVFGATLFYAGRFLGGMAPRQDVGHAPHDGMDL